VLLYDSGLSGNCYKVRLLLAQLGLPYERREVDVFDLAPYEALRGWLERVRRQPGHIPITA